MLPALIAFTLGVALQLQQLALQSRGSYALIAACAGMVITGVVLKRAAAHRQRRLVMGALALAAAALGFGLAGWQASGRAAQALTPQLEGMDIDVQGTVAAMPQPFSQGLRFRFEVQSAQASGQAVALPPLLQLSWYQTQSRSHPGEADGGWQASAGPPPLRAGERWQLRVRLKAPHGNINPHGFDYELWLWEQGLGATGTVRAGPKDPAPQRLASGWRYPVEQARQRVRERIMQTVSEPRSAGVLAALTLGDQGAIERADWDVFRATGVAHLVSISGLHITLFAWLAVQCLGALWRRGALWGWWVCQRLSQPMASRTGGLLLATAYALFSGWGLPAQRTVWMLACFTAVSLLGLRWHWSRVWALACAVVVALDPWALLSAGFWLSFVAVGALFASDEGTGSAAFKPTTPPAHSPAQAGVIRALVAKLPLTARRMLREQSVISLALAPLSLLLFGQVSVLGWAANLLAIPWVTLLVTPLALAGMVWQPLWQLAAWALQGMAVVLQAMAACPWALLSVATPPPLLAAAALLGALLLVLRLPWALRGAGLLMALPMLLYQAPRPAPGQFELIAADVGQGSAVLLRTAQHSLLYDTGPRYSSESDAGQRALVPLLRALGERLDLLVLSHRDTDHTGGAQAVLQMQPQARLLAGIDPPHPLQTLRPITPCRAGDAWDWDGVRIEVLHPQEGERSPRTNGNSCVLRVSNGAHTALLLGDIEAVQEAQLIARLGTSALQSHWLLAPHHGSKSSSSPQWVQATQPRFVLVQSGYRNRFAHPAPAVVARWQAAGAQVLASPQCGAATWRSSAPDRLDCERAKQQRYWRHWPDGRPQLANG